MLYYQLIWCYIIIMLFSYHCVNFLIYYAILNMLHT